MEKTKEIEFSRLLGFAAVREQISGDVDFRDETIGAKLGAKVGDEVEPAPSGLQFAKLLGFAAVGGQLAGDVDFSDETLGAKLGAKVGTDEAEPAPSRHIEAADK